MRTPANVIQIGLVNNMPASALEATERQFRTLLADATPDGISVKLSFFALPELSSSPNDKRRTSGRYSDVATLWNSRLDGLIVTGAEPVTRNLPDEPYWASLTKLLDWADRNTYSSVWSCLAAHAAVLWLDGIERRPLGDKLFGVFECQTVADSRLGAGLTNGLRDRLNVPHSRWNGVTIDPLAGCGYEILTSSPATGMDAFVKQKNSLFVFFQGHPEYEADSLLLEYRRDIGRFLQGERETYPLAPQGYFDVESTVLIDSFRERALFRHSNKEGKGTLADFPLVPLAQKLLSSWRPAATSIYRNWLHYLAEQKRGKRKAGAKAEVDARLVPAAK